MRRAECGREAGSFRPRVHLRPVATTRETNSKARQSLCHPVFLCLGHALSIAGVACCSVMGGPGSVGLTETGDGRSGETSDVLVGLFFVCLYVRFDRET
jgi:hypothetical protein